MTKNPKDLRVAVTSKSFSKNPILRERVLEIYPNAKFNDQGVNFDESSLIEFLTGCDRAIIALDKINRRVLEALPSLRAISKFGVGIDNIDFIALKERNILFGYRGGVNRRSVAELALQMMLVLIRKSFQSNCALRRGEWSPQFGNNLSGKVVGILGLGNIGKELVTLLQPFDCKILVNDIRVDKQFCQEKGLVAVELDELFSSSDIISIHVPLNNTTKGMVNRRLLDLIKPEGVLINTARGGIVDEESLYSLLKSNRIGAAGFDVFAREPLANSQLALLDNFFCTPHIGGSSKESILAMGFAAIEGLSVTEETSVYF